jgi:hypothetical protein
VAVLAHGSGERGPEIRQPPGLGVDSLHAGGERDRTAATDVDVEVESVLDTLASGITWNPMRGPPPSGSMMLAAPIPSSLLRQL